MHCLTWKCLVCFFNRHHGHNGFCKRWDSWLFSKPKIWWSHGYLPASRQKTTRGNRLWLFILKFWSYFAFNACWLNILICSNNWQINRLCGIGEGSKTVLLTCIYKQCKSGSECIARWEDRVDPTILYSQNDIAKFWLTPPALCWPTHIPTLCPPFPQNASFLCPHPHHSPDLSQAQLGLTHWLGHLSEML